MTKLERVFKFYNSQTICDFEFLVGINLVSVNVYNKTTTLVITILLAPKNVLLYFNIHIYTVPGIKM